MSNAKRTWGWLARHRYETIAIIDGAVIMMLEITGARFIQPFFGNSIYVWTAVIGVILGALSLGYWYGGRLADRVASDRILSRIIMVAAAILAASLYIKDDFLAWLAAAGGDIRWQAFAASVVLFGPMNFFMGLVSPYLAKLKITGLASAGRSVGGLYAAGTAGSILGTFITGYWLIGLVGSRNLATSLILVLLASSALAYWRRDWWLRLGIALATLGLFAGVGIAYVVPAGSKIAADVDSAYTHWRVIDARTAGTTLRYLSVEQQDAQSGIILGNPQLVPFTYMTRFLSVAGGMPAAKRVLIIGGGAYTMPAHLLAQQPDLQIDLVEIDPKLDQLATDYFGYQPDRRVSIIHEDGRVFLNGKHQPYDIIFMDAFNSLSPPFQLTTSEAVARIKANLAPGGVVAVNLVARAGDRFAASERLTYERHFGAVDVAPAIAGSGYTGRQNFIMLASADKAVVPQLMDRIGTGRTPQTSGGQLLTDNFAPVEQLTSGF